MDAIKKVCANCGSEDVWVDAVAAWDVENQGWELASTFLEHAVCVECGGEGIDLNDVAVGGGIAGLHEEER